MQKISSFQYPNLIGIILSLIVFSFVFFNFEQFFTKYTCLACQIVNQNKYILAVIGIYFIRILIICLAFFIFSYAFKRVYYDDKILKSFTMVSKKVMRISEIDKIDLFYFNKGNYVFGFFSKNKSKINFTIGLVGQVFFEDLLIYLVNKNSQIVITIVRNVLGCFNSEI